MAHGSTYLFLSILVMYILCQQRGPQKCYLKPTTDVSGNDIRNTEKAV